VAESSYQLSNSGAEMLVGADGDLFLSRSTAASGKQLTATGESEHDPKLSPDGRLVAFRRREDLSASTSPQVRERA